MGSTSLRSVFFPLGLGVPLDRIMAVRQHVELSFFTLVETIYVGGSGHAFNKLSLWVSVSEDTTRDSPDAKKFEVPHGRV